MSTDTLNPSGDTVDRGKAIYERDIRALVEADHHGKFMAIDVDSGRWEIADDEYVAATRLRAEQPGAENVFLMRVGYPALRHIGSAPLAVTE